MEAQRTEETLEYLPLEGSTSGVWLYVCLLPENVNSLVFLSANVTPKLK